VDALVRREKRELDIIALWYNIAKVSVGNKRHGMTVVDSQEAIDYFTKLTGVQPLLNPVEYEDDTGNAINEDIPYFTKDMLVEQLKLAKTYIRHVIIRLKTTMGTFDPFNSSEYRRAHNTTIDIKHSLLPMPLCMISCRRCL
jgi:hypothetical protein